jgi:hypothetical protein
VFLPFVKGGAKRLRGLLQLLEGNFRAADAVGTVHDMRFVFVDNDTKLLFATAYDGDFDPYIADFAAKIPNAMDLWLCNFEGYPGMRNPSSAADWIAKHQIAAEAWYVNSPDLTAAETRRLEKVGKAVEELLGGRELAADKTSIADWLEAVVLKLLSEIITHKSDAGGVRRACEDEGNGAVRRPNGRARARFTRSVSITRRPPR